MRIRSKIFGKDFFHFADALAEYPTEVFPLSHLMHQLKSRQPVTEAKLQSAGVSLVDQSHFKAFHRKRNAGAHRNRVQTVGITIKIHLGNRVGIKYSQVRPAAGDGFIFGSVDKNLFSFIRSAKRDKFLDPMGAGNGASHPATVEAGIKQAPVYFLAQIRCLAMLAEAKIVSRQQVVVIHDGDQMGGADFGHFVLFWIQLRNLA